jgi:hypothetical protein
MSSKRDLKCYIDNIGSNIGNLYDVLLNYDKEEDSEEKYILCRYFDGSKGKNYVDVCTIRESRQINKYGTPFSNLTILNWSEIYNFSCLQEHINKLLREKFIVMSSKINNIMPTHNEILETLRKEFNYKFQLLDSIYFDCKICCEQKKCILLKPCNHCYLCSKCADGIKECGICRGQVTGTEKIFL